MATRRMPRAVASPSMERREVDRHNRIAYPRSSGSGFRAHLLEAGIGQVSEIFDGDAPHAPRGCIAQAWSVAELIPITG